MLKREELPTGLERGGVLEAPWIERDYVDANVHNLRSKHGEYTFSPMTVFDGGVGFYQSDTSRRITGTSGAGCACGASPDGLGATRFYPEYLRHPRQGRMYPEYLRRRLRSKYYPEYL